MKQTLDESKYKVYDENVALKDYHQIIKDYIKNNKD